MCGGEAIPHASKSRKHCNYYSPRLRVLWARAIPSEGRLNKSRSEDRATGHDNEVVLGHQKTSEEALEASESAAAAAAPMAPGAPSQEENRLALVGGTSPHARENAPEGAQGQEPLHGKQQQQPSRPGQATLLGASRMSLLCPHPTSAGCAA